jgi:hypothetical protein
MNSNHQSQQGQHNIAERVAHLETAIDHQRQAVTGLRDELRAGFVRTDAEFLRMHKQLLRIRTTDFRILLRICLTTALGTAGLIIKVFGLLPSP